MGRIVITEHVTLDGVVEDSEAAVGSFEFDRSEEGEALPARRIEAGGPRRRLIVIYRASAGR